MSTGGTKYCLCTGVQVSAYQARVRKATKPQQLLCERSPELPGIARKKAVTRQRPNAAQANSQQIVLVPKLHLPLNSAGAQLQHELNDSAAAAAEPLLLAEALTPSSQLLPSQFKKRLYPRLHRSSAFHLQRCAEGGPNHYRPQGVVTLFQGNHASFVKVTLSPRSLCASRSSSGASTPRESVLPFLSDKASPSSVGSGKLRWTPLPVGAMSENSSACNSPIVF